MLRSLTVMCALSVALVLAACGGTGDSTGQDPGREDGRVTEEASPEVREAVADLARRLDVAEEEIVVAGVEQVTWNDGSLGCADPETMYTQALVEGSRITLRAGERSYEYHAGQDRPPFLCEDPTQ